MITNKCKQTAENSCSLFYKQKKTAIPRDWPSDFASPYHFSTYVIVFSTRVLKTNSAQKTYIFVVKGKTKISSKNKKYVHQSLGFSTKNHPPPLFTAMYSP